MHRQTKRQTLIILSTLLLLASLSVQAVPIRTFNLTANCVDCAAAAGTLTHAVDISLSLRNYTLGDRITRRNFQRFDYSGSNLVNDFSLTRRDWRSNMFSFLSGYIPQDYVAGEAFQFSLFSSNWRWRRARTQMWSCTERGWEVADPVSACMNTHRLFFAMSDTGRWQLGIPAKDEGNMDLAQNQQAVPEPASLGLLMVGLALGRRFTAKPN